MQANPTTKTPQQRLMLKARKRYIELFPITSDKAYVRMNRRYIFEWITRANCDYKLSEYRDLYQLGVHHSLMGYAVTLPEVLTSDIAWKVDKRVNGKRAAYIKGYDFAEGWKPLTPLERAEVDGDGSHCDSCGVFIPSGADTDSHAETCPVGIALARA